MKLFITLFFTLFFICNADYIPEVVTKDTIISSETILRYNIKIENNATLLFKPGLKLHMNNQGILVKHGRIIFSGTSNKPIKVVGSRWEIHAEKGIHSKIFATFTDFKGTKIVMNNGDYLTSCSFTGDSQRHARAFIDTFWRVRKCRFTRFEKTIINNSPNPIEDAQFTYIGYMSSLNGKCERCSTYNVPYLHFRSARDSIFNKIGRAYITRLHNSTISDSHNSIARSSILNCGDMTHNGCQISNCLFINNKGKSIVSAYGHASGYIENSVFKNNMAEDSVIVAGIKNLRNNNFVSNNGKYILRAYLKFGDDIDATNNYWGTINPGAIQNKIYDSHTNKTLAKVKYIPFLKK